jgi:hypothetical protein
MKRSLSHPPDRLFYGGGSTRLRQDAVKGGRQPVHAVLLPSQRVHLSRAATSLPSRRQLESAIEGPLVGHLIDRFDVRVMLVIGTRSPGSVHPLIHQSYLVFVLVFMGPMSLGFQAGFTRPPWRRSITGSAQARARDVDRADRAGHRRVLIFPWSRSPS